MSEGERLSAAGATPENEYRFKLVTIGLYRFSRNPMYIGVLTIVSGWSLRFMSRGLLMYVLILAVGFHLRVILFEEPWAARTFGDEWVRYKARVRRWAGTTKTRQRGCLVPSVDVVPLLSSGKVL